MLICCSFAAYHYRAVAVTEQTLLTMKTFQIMCWLYSDERGRGEGTYSHPRAHSCCSLSRSSEFWQLFAREYICL